MFTTVEVLRTIEHKKKYLKNGFDFSDRFFVFDTENYGGLEPKPSNFALGVIYGKDYKKVLYSPQEVKEELKHPRYNGKTIFAHNAEYDIQVTWGNVFTKLDRSALYVGSKFICANIDKSRKLRISDSSNLLLTSVAKLGVQLGFPKLETPNKFLNSNERVPVDEDDILYCIRDCAVVFKALCIFFQRVGEMKITVASSAMHYFRSSFLKRPIFYDRELCNNFFESYYGGRTEVFKLGECNLKVYDMNSMYPFRMIQTKFPHPSYLKVLKRPDLDYFKNFILKHYGGCADVTVIHKDHYFGHLPVKYNTGTNVKLLFPVGEFRTTVNFNELQYAIVSGVVEVKKVHKVTYSTKWMESPFIDYILTNYKERITTDFEYLIYLLKILMNSLYGKFAERIREKQTYFESIQKALYFISKQPDRSKFDVKLFSKKRKDCILVENLDEALQPEHSIPLFASYITSTARVDMLKALKENGRPAYCDTDSIFKGGEFIGELGNELGQWKEEKKTITEIRGLKNYTYEDENGNIIDSIKGVGKRAEKLGKGHFVEEKFYKSKAALRSGRESGEKFILEKKLSGIYDKRKILENGETEPIKFVNLHPESLLTKNSKNDESKTVTSPQTSLGASPSNVQKEIGKARVRLHYVYNSKRRRRSNVVPIGERQRRTHRDKSRTSNKFYYYVRIFPI